jgi:hypothetical protein
MKKTTPASLAPGLSSEGIIREAIAAYSAPSLTEKILNSGEFRLPSEAFLQAERIIGVVKTIQDLLTTLEEFCKNKRRENTLFITPPNPIQNGRSVVYSLTLSHHYFNFE